MIVCLCNNLNDAAIQRAIEAGMDSYKTVLAFNQCLPRCGMCKANVNALRMLTANNQDDQTLNLSSSTMAS